MKKNTLRILALGDIVSPGAVSEISARLWKFREDNDIDFVIANGENACVGNGLDPASAKKLLTSGVDTITSGNHIWRKKEMHSWLDEGHPVLRPANYHATAPGEGHIITDVCGYRLLIINVLGVIYMEPLENPIRCISRILDYYKGAMILRRLMYMRKLLPKKLQSEDALTGKFQLYTARIRMYRLLMNVFCRTEQDI